MPVPMIWVEAYAVKVDPALQCRSAGTLQEAESCAV